MIKRIIDIDNYWKVIVYYNIDYNLFHIITSSLKQAGCNDYQIDSIYENMFHKHSKAVTISNINKHISVVLFNKHHYYNDYINSIIHEAEHIKQSMLESYNVDDNGEAPAYTVGYVGMKLLMYLI